ncbi:MAG TPA: cytochrome c3 family protein [Pelolinea sp.]|nr:cytochrome c3 family protein [Pelolinea sp.]
MNKRLFVMLIVGLFAGLAGWVFYVSTQAKESASVQKISVDWWGSAHADVTAEAFVHWNEDEPPQVPPNCAKCHSGTAFIDFLGQDGSAAMKVDKPGLIESVITCTVCHNEKADVLELVTFPSGEEIRFDPGDALCGTCHSGLSAGSRVDSAAGGISDDEIVPDASFITPHYAFAAATSLGGEAKVGFEYPGKAYAGKFIHAEGVESCTQCHEPHNLRMQKDYTGENVSLCGACHSNVTGFADYRDVFVDGVDYDFDGTVEGVYHEIQGMQKFLMTSIQLYVKETLDTTIGWADAFPYLFVDTNGDGEISEDEAAFPNRYTQFTPRLMRAAFNYQFSAKEPGGYVHNGKYVLQLLYDAIEDLSTVVDAPLDGLVRP